MSHNMAKAGLSQQGTGFVPRPVPLNFVIDGVALGGGTGFSPDASVFLVIIIRPVLHIHCDIAGAVY